MSPVVSALLAFLAACFCSRRSLQLEILALRHQPTDRLFWAWLSRLWSGWQSALAFVQPHTMITWQRQLSSAKNVSHVPVTQAYLCSLAA
jgi:hypothetical protein